MESFPCTLHSDSADSLSSGEEVEARRRSSLRSASEGDMQLHMAKEYDLRQRPLSEEEGEEKRKTRKRSIIDASKITCAVYVIVIIVI